MPESCLDDGVIMSQGIKVIVEDSLADDVQRKTGEEVLHLNRLATSAGPAQRAGAVQSTLAKHVHHRRNIPVDRQPFSTVMDHDS